ncbi:transcription termination/antitermination protein NusA [Spirochaetia bacterium]|nr:transcription termination/antitermination protein NusA [Spirochaetia bacterium]
MATDVSEAILQLIQDRGMSEDLAFRTIEETLLAAYKRYFGTANNAVVRFTEDKEVSLFARKIIVDGVYDPVAEIDLENAQKINPESEEGDELLIEVNPRDFSRDSVKEAKVTATRSVKDIQKDSLYSEFKSKEGELIIGYYRRQRDGNIYVDLGKEVEGKFPKEYQSPREEFHVNDRIRALIYEVSKDSSGLHIILSRFHTDFVKAIFELEVPEIYDKTVGIHKIVRKAGYRTKLAVYSNRDDVDPVGACVGQKGARIQAVVKELEGEKIDVFRYDPDPKRYIENALSPAKIQDVFILDEGKHQALAVVEENQLSLAIGKQGLNVQLANRLVDWSIDVKTEKQFREMGIVSESSRAATELFNDDYEEQPGEEMSRLVELPGADPHVVRAFLEHDIDFIEDFLGLSEQDLAEFKDITPEQQQKIRNIIEEYVEIVEEEEESPELADNEIEVESDEAEEVYECPDCGAPITVDMTVCPQCGIGLSFEDEDESAQQL